MPRIISYANVASTLALVLALSGGAYAAATITGKDVKNESLTGKDVKNKTLGGKDVRDSSLTGTDVRDSSLTGADLTDGSLSGADLADGSVDGADVKDGSVAGADLKDGSVTGADVADGSLAAADLAAGTLDLPGATAVVTGGGTIPSGPANTFTFDSELFDTGGMFSAPGSVVTVPRTGTYLLSGAITFGGTGAFERQIRLIVNGTIGAITDSNADYSTHTMQVTITRRLTAGDTVTLGTFNGSGAPIAIANFSTSPDAWLSVQMVSP